MTPREKKLRAQLGGLSNASKPGYNGQEATRAAYEARRARYAAQVDPEGKLGPAELAVAVNRAWQADMVRAKLRKAGERRKRAARRVAA